MIINKKIVSVLSLFCFLIQSGIAQSSFESSEGGRFLKRTEYNFLAPGLYNLKSKTGVEKLFFGDFNAKLEFFVEPSFEGAYGFRIVRDSTDTSYLLEIRRINNFDEVSAQLSKEYPVIGFPAKEMSSISEEERTKRYKVDTH
jgi:hypothetical protein